MILDINDLSIKGIDVRPVGQRLWTLLQYVSTRTRRSDAQMCKPLLHRGLAVVRGTVAWESHIYPHIGPVDLELYDCASTGTSLKG